MMEYGSEKIGLPVLPPLKRNRVGRLSAPHKPVLLLAVIDLIEAGEIRQPRFEVTEAMVEAFTLEWKRHVSIVGCFVAKPWNPIHHMEDGIIHRELRPGKNPARYATSVRQCRDLYEYLQLNEKLFAALQVPESRAYLRNMIVATYLSDPNPMTVQTPLVTLLTLTVSQLLAG